MMNPWLVREIEPSKNKADSGQDEQHIDRDLKLPIRESLEDAPSEPRTEQRSWNEVFVFQSSCVSVEDDGRMR